jgi:2-iminobutanoate/2-iminopropanoate deaminase
MQFDPKAVPLSRYRRAGELVFLSGQIAIDRNGAMVAPDIEGQTRRVLENISAVLSECGCALKDVINATVWLRDDGDFAQFNLVYAEYFPENPPALSMVISDLLAGAPVEIAVVASFPASKGGPDGDPHLAGTGMRLVDLDDMQDLRATMSAELSGFHGLLSCRPVPYAARTIGRTEHQCVSVLSRPFNGRRRQRRAARHRLGDQSGEPGSSAYCRGKPRRSVPRALSLRAAILADCKDRRISLGRVDVQCCRRVQTLSRAGLVACHCRSAPNARASSSKSKSSCTRPDAYRATPKSTGVPAPST